MRKVMKIALALGIMLATSLVLGCGTDDGEKWCVLELPDSAITKELKSCYKIYPESEYIWARSEAACRGAAVTNPNIKVSNPPSRNECGYYDDGKKSK
ncbi:MAG: hypothetical protein FWF63_11300 [Fibromonadales bacterium]|nr:hypothetical protein [Fibromonadales bacterium]